MNEFAAIIREQRERKRIRAYDFAYQLGQVPSWVTKLESGSMSHPPAPSVLRGIAGVLDLPETELLRALGYLSEDEPTDDPVDLDRLGLVSRLRRVRLTPERVGSLERILDLYLSFDASDGAKEDTGERDGIRVAG